ncbi:MAG: rhomboid family intramembrane serine protease [Geobacter sp.]|nr:MAG: rhomboid family intramembrane serine protease [Geobacter sp.]
MGSEAEVVETGSDSWRPVPADLRAGTSATVALSRQRASLWALVLESRSVPCRVEQAVGGWALLVPPGFYLPALEELRLFEEANRNWPPLAPKATPLVENTLSTLSVLLLVATFHNLTRLDIPLFGHPPLHWLELGSAQAGKILDGQWWRTVTALTLHSGALHLFGNLTIGGFFIVHLCRDLGSGLAWTLLLLSGILGTLTNAWFQPEYHTSIGASTLVFGAVGILAALQVIRGKNRRWKNWFLPVAGALALLAMLGTEGENTDIGAHLFGFIFGILLGLMGEYFVERFGRPGSRVNFLLALTAAAVPVVAWWAAVVSGS